MSRGAENYGGIGRIMPLNLQGGQRIYNTQFISYIEILSFCHLIRNVDYNILPIPYCAILVIYLWLDISQQNFFNQVGFTPTKKKK